MSTSIPAFDAVLAGVFERRTHVAPIVVGITGPDTSGKSQMASRMQAVLAQSGVAATIVHVDDFHNPKKIRYDERLTESEAYLEKSIDMERLIDGLLRPLRDTGTLNAQLQHLDLDSDTFSIKKNYVVAAGGVMIVEGIFLLREDVREFIDYMVFLHVEPQEMLDRAYRRDVPHQGLSVLRKYHEKYIPGQRFFLQQNRPQDHADVIIDNSRWHSPTVIPVARTVQSLLEEVDAQWILFDLWETLVPLPQATKAQAFYAFCEHLDEDPRLLRTAWDATRQARETRPLEQYLDELSQNLDKKWSSTAVRDALAARRAIHGAEFYAAQPRITRELGKISGSGRLLGLVSNCSSDVRSLLADSGISDSFAAITLSSEAGRMKPAPSIFEQAAALLNATPSETIFVGDGSDFELVGALTAGLHPVRLAVHDRIMWPGTTVDTLSILADACAANPRRNEKLREG